jgi:DNA-directed RNA polymerase II subunit RPB1
MNSNPSQRKVWRRLPDSTIKAVHFSIRSDEETKRQAVVEVSNKNIFRNGVPVQGGVYDPAMGTTDIHWKCTYCNQKKPNCLGHPGYMSLRYPVIEPTMIKTVLHYAKVICLDCGAFMLGNSRIADVPKSKLLAAYVAKTRNKKRKNKDIDKDVKINMKCPVCSKIHPHITLDTEAKSDNIDVVILQVMYDVMGNATKKRIYNHELLNSFERVSDETVTILGKPLSAHPKHMISWNIVVPSNIIRPDKKVATGGISGNNDLTLIIQQIAEYNGNLPDIIPDVIDNKLSGRYTDISQAYHNLHMNSTDTNANKKNKAQLSNLNGIKGRTPLKSGRIRNDLMGGRCFVMARSVISGDPRLKLHEIGVPLFMCRKLYKDVMVGHHNYDECMMYFKNGRDRYPGCHSIIKGSTMDNHSIDLINDDIVLEHGDIIRRDMINGDKVVFGRQPSLWDLSLRCFDIVVMESGYTLRINPCVCVFFNADFDGDECNITCITHMAVEIEMDMYCSVAVSGTNHQDGSSIAGMFQNSLWAISKLTQSDTSMNAEIAMQCMSLIPNRVHLDPEKEEFSGRELVSRIIPNKVNLKATAFMYNPMYPVKYNEDDINVKIVKGELISGVLDLSTVGQRRTGSIFHIVNNLYGPREANSLIYDMQQMGDAFISQYGSTIHLGDIIIPKEARDILRKQTESVVEQYGLLFDDKVNGRIIAPLDMTSDQFFERQAQEILQLTEHIKTILAYVDINTNNLYHMVFRCKKGNKKNVASVMSSIGQQTILGYRLSWNKWRGSQYFTYFSRDPGSHGFIRSSLSDGLSVDEVMAMSEEVRYGLINRQMGAATTGHQNREANKNMESIVVGAYRRVLRNKKYIVQSLHGGQGIDIRSIIYVKLKGPFMSDDHFESIFHATPEDFGHEKDNDHLRAILDGEFNRIKNDRNVFRSNMLNIEQMYMEPTLASDTVSICFDIKNMILSIIHESDGRKREFDPVDAIEQITNFTENRLPYVFTNRFQQQKRARVPIQHTHAITAACMVLREYMCVKNMKRIGMDNKMLAIILDFIFIRYKTSLTAPGLAVGLIASQSLHEIYTQFMLDAHLRAGIGGTNVKDKLRGIELMVARKTKLMKNPSMLLHVKPEFQHDKAKVAEIASKIETLYFRMFVTPNDADIGKIDKESHGMYFGGEIFNNPEHKLLKNTTTYITNMKKYMNIQAPADLSTYGILFHLNMKQMIQKHMDIQTLVYELRKYDDKIFIVHSSEIDEVPSIYCYIRSSAFEKNASSNVVLESIEKMILNTIVRGVDKIEAATVREFQRSYIDKDGGTKQDSIYAIATVGTNMRDILTISELDTTKCQTDSIHEMADVLGITAARQKIITEMRVSFAGPAAAHYTIFADEMTFTGAITGITKAGADTRDNDVFPRASYVQPITVLADAALNARSDPVRCASTSLMLGAAITDIGTSSVRIITDEDAVRNQTNSVEDML